MTEAIQKQVSKWYFYSDTEPSMIGKIECTYHENINIDNKSNIIVINFYDGRNICDYLYSNKGIKLFVKREYKCVDCETGKTETIIEKFSSTDFNFDTDIYCDGKLQNTIELENVQFLGRRKSEVKEIYEFW